MFECCRVRLMWLIVFVWKGLLPVWMSEWEIRQYIQTMSSELFGLNNKWLKQWLSASVNEVVYMLDSSHCRKDKVFEIMSPFAWYEDQREDYFFPVWDCDIKNIWYAKIALSTWSDVCCSKLIHNTDDVSSAMICSFFLLLSVCHLSFLFSH